MFRDLKTRQEELKARMDLLSIRGKREGYVKEHIHKFQRVLWNKETGYTVYKCVIPGCKYSLRKELLLARESICWKCGNNMFLNEANLKQRKPVHFGCRKGSERNAA